MAIVNSKSYYDDLLNDNVLFLQGTLFDLNKYLPTAPTTFPDAEPYTEDERGKQNSLRGHAIEGAFYLTTDTHRLYIGRKVTSVPDPNPYGIEINDIYPEEISSGIATVEDTTELAQVQTGGAAHDGDFYYIKGSNVLAVYEEDELGGGHWLQVNSPTGIDSFLTTISNAAPTNIPDFSLINTSSYAKIKEALKPSGVATPTETEYWLKAGDNINLKASALNIIEISSINSLSELNIEPSSDSDNNAKIILSDGINFNSEIIFEGEHDTTTLAEEEYSLSNDTTVVSYKPYYLRTGNSDSYTYTLITNPSGNPNTNSYYERKNKITITGPGVKGTYITTQGSIGATEGISGFKVAVLVLNGATNNTNNKAITTGGANSILDPIITIGGTTNTEVSYKFYGGTAKLPIYTKNEVDTLINNSITSALNVTDALHYKGTVSNYNDLSALNNGNLANGDVYKASGKFSYTDGNNSITIKVGDLLIAQGQETNGKIPSGSATWQIVPSGDEPLLVGKITNSSIQGAGPGFGFEDSNISANYDPESSLITRLDKRPLYVSIDNANSTLIRASANTEQSADNFKIQLHHIAPVSNPTTNVVNITSATLITSNANSDSLATKDNTLTFLAISSITRDPNGHIIDISGLTISLKHNYLTQLTGSYSANTETNVGKIVIGANDALGISNSAVTKVNVLFGSETLKITNTESQLNMNLVWGSF